MALSANFKSPLGDAESRLSDSERDRLYKQNWQDFETKYTAWVASLDIARVDLRSLTHREVLGSFLAPTSRTLAEAEGSADLAVGGEVTAIRPTAFDGTYVTLRLGTTYKGTAPAALVVHQGGGLRPTSDWKGMYIADSPDAPLMLPGDQVVLLLRTAPTGYEPEPFTGLYWVEPSGMRSVPGNPFAAAVNGRSRRDFEAALRS